MVYTLHTCIPSTLEAKVGKSKVQGQPQTYLVSDPPGLYNETLSLNKTKQKLDEISTAVSS